ncbi:XRE family transcriptional regulator [Phyllobacterium zundukense]|uniref:XRE family transcriptional regulator n=1 Tax=Phyllobacterium zundukense TaxID=1867719 RepID=A0ACD4CXK2_9HYPH|nr:XRE family transcriptional regulator [Phyllobacterium zundukense]UXN58274.1 XRE family transcriptional regulator [Phyllobacterium zundukense]
MITSSQCRAARALVGYSIDRLSVASGVSREIIEMFERRLENAEPEDIASLQSALEKGGAIFIPDGDTGGIGVRLKFNRSQTKHIATLEGEGGIVGSDDVP